MTPIQEKLMQLGACQEAIDWCADQTGEQAWLACDRLEWLQWIVMAPARADYDRIRAPYRITTAALACTTCDQLRAEFARPQW